MSRHLRLLLALITLTLVALAGAAGWLLGTAGGLQTAVRLAGDLSGGRLQIAGANGCLLGPLVVEQLRWQDNDLQIAADGLRLSWTPKSLLRKALVIDELLADNLHIVVANSDQPSTLPADLRLPLAVGIKKLGIAQLHYGEHFVATDLAGRFSSDGRQHELDDFHGRTADIAVDGRLRLDGAAPFALFGQVRLTGQLEGRPLSIALDASGPLERIALKAVAVQGIAGRCEALLTPFAGAFFASARLQLDDLDPAAWWAGSPTGRITLVADLVPQGDGVAGSFGLTNHRPGPLDHQRLPLQTLSGSLEWQGKRLHLPTLHAMLPGNGRLEGDGAWQDAALHLNLRASRLDVSQLASALRATRLDGRLAGTLGSTRQALRVDLRDTRYRLQAEASHADGRIAVPQLLLAAGDARLQAQGELDLQEPRHFTAVGELQRFDPARFADLPAAQLNARWQLAGQLLPGLSGKLDFDLRDSRLANQTLSGAGHLTVDGQRLPKVDLQLQAGANRLLARGAFGQAGDRIDIDLDAPQLAPYGLEGGFNAHLSLTGSPETPLLGATLTAERLGLPGAIRLNGLNFKAELGNRPISPLQIELQIARLDTPEQPSLLRAIRLNSTGTTTRQQWQLGADLPDRSHLVLRAEGGLNREFTAWQGTIAEASLRGGAVARQFRLTAPSPLILTGTGWRFGPARLAGEPLDWQATLQGEADTRQLQMQLQARGSRIGQIDARLTAGLRSPWSLDEQAPWQGRLNADIADLGWLAESIGEGWRSEGKLNGEIRLGGTPARPLGSGALRGEKLALRLPEQGLQLVKGELDAELRDNLLTIRRFAFDSLLQTPPRALRNSVSDDLAPLTARPGQLEIAGEIRVDRSQGAERAAIDLHLDRLGAWQLADRWIVLSGDSRLVWQNGTLGVHGKLAVDAGYWQFAPSGTPRLSDDVVVRRAGNEASTPGLRPRLDIDVTADIGRNFLFNGAGLNSRLSGEVRISAQGRDLPRASGVIRTRGGRFDAYGQKLDIERGILTFNGLLDNPGLDVRALRKGLSVEAGVQIGGTARRPVIRLISDPELPDAEKLAWLVLGHGPDQMGAGDATVLFSAAGGLLGNDSGNVVQQLKKTIGVDEFGIRQGALGDSGSRQRSSRVTGGTVDTSGTSGQQILSVGKRLSSNALLAYEQTLGKAEGVVKLTVNLTRRIAVVGRAGSDNAIDFFYALSFGRTEEKPVGK